MSNIIPQSDEADTEQGSFVHITESEKKSRACSNDGEVFDTRDESRSESTSTPQVPLALVDTLRSC